MRAAEIEGRYPEWRSYLNGPSDYRSLLEITGMGPARAALLLRVYGSIDAFLAADPDDVRRRTRAMIGRGLADTLQQRCLRADISSDWSRLEAEVTVAEPERRRWSGAGLRDFFRSLLPG